MSLECPTEAPYYFKFVLHTLGLISVPINSLGCYLVIFHSAKHSNYKYCLLYLQVVTFIVEIYMSWIAPGYYFFPMIGGYITNSYVAQIISGHFSVVFYFFFFAFEIPALAVCFQTRHDYVAELKREKKLSKYFTKFMVYSSHLFPFAVSILLFFSELPYQKQYEIISQNYPKCLHVLKIPGFALYDYKENVYFLSVGIIVFLALLIYGGYITFLSGYTMYILRSLRSSMSSVTYRHHNTALIALSLQCFIPVTLVFIPINIIIIIIYNNYVDLQELATDSMFSMTAHSTVSTIVMISFNTTYREWVLHRFRKVTKVKNLSRTRRSISVMPTTTTDNAAMFRVR